jgi:thiamine biosynthesis protein ThiS
MIIVNGKNTPWHQGLTISEILSSLNDPYPYVVVRINGKHVSLPDFENYQIPDESEVYLMPLITGG